MSDKRVLLGERIRAARKERHLSQRELAKRSNISFPTVQRIEAGKGNVTANNLAAVLRALDSVAKVNIRIFEGLDYEEFVNDVLSVIKSQARDEIVSDYTWRQEEIIKLVKRIRHTPLLNTLLDVTHAIYTEDLFIRGELIGRDKTMSELLDIDEHPDAIEAADNHFREEIDHAAKEEGQG